MDVTTVIIWVGMGICAAPLIAMMFSLLSSMVSPPKPEE